MIAVISDIHANLEALTRVLSDVASQGIQAKDIVCLGDIVGYGPDPAECVDLAMGWRVVLMGNHDEAATREAYGFNAPAQEALKWTHEALMPGFLSLGHKRARWEFLKNLPKTHQEMETFFVHGSPRDPTLEYILRTDTEELTGGVPDKIRDIFTRFDRTCLVGHTHDPGVITEDSRFLCPVDFGGTFTLTPGQKFVVNVGSVGQPRDGDPRACYVLYDGATVRYRRVEYEIAKTIEKIRRIPQIDPRFGERLLKGR